MALASQNARPQSFARTSNAYRASGRDRTRRIAGVSLLAVLGIGAVMYLMRHRDGASGGSIQTAAVAPTATGNPTMVPPSDPMARNPSHLVPLNPTGQPAQSAPPPQRPQPASFSMGTTPVKASDLAQIPNPAPSSAPIPTTQPSPIGALPSGGSPPPPAPVRDPLAVSTPTPSTITQPDPSALPADLQEFLSAADRATQMNRYAEARDRLNRVLLDPRTTDADRVAFRARIADLNATALFSPAPSPGDPLVDTVTVAGGDSLTKISRRTGSVTEPGMIARVNKLANPNALHVGQSLKVLRGPFHAVVSKSKFRMDIYAGPFPSATSLNTSPLPDGAEPGWVYIRSFDVGHGESGSTPIANFVVKDNSKLVDPAWANPRTGEKFASSDPKNPIGERWIGLEGLDEPSKKFTGFGVHGTIDPASIGHERSMGCVRLQAPDIEFIYELLMPRVSVVKIVP